MTACKQNNYPITFLHNKPFQYPAICSQNSDLALQSKTSESHKQGAEHGLNGLSNIRTDRNNYTKSGIKIIKSIGAVAAFIFSSSLIANTNSTLATDAYRPWSIVGSLGYTWFDNLYDGGNASSQTAIGDGQTALGRFAVAKEFFIIKSAHIGFEVGVQNGNLARLNISESAIESFGGVLPQVTIKPMLDALLTLSWQPIESLPIFAIIKPGIGYRRLQINDRTTFNDLSQVSFETQAGFGVHVSEKATISLNYQGIFNGSTSYSLNNVTFTGHISNIPSQNGILLSASYII